MNPDCQTSSDHDARRAPRTRTRSRIALSVLLGCSLFLMVGARAANIAAPDINVSARLVWATMIAVDNANRTGNYSVLRGIGSSDFQAANSTERLAEIFRPLRYNRVDVGRAILIEPTFYLPPSVDSNGLLRLRGGFEFRPKSLRFDLLFKFEEGGWRLLGVSVLETSSNAPR